MLQTSLPIKTKVARWWIIVGGLIWIIFWSFRIWKYVEWALPLKGEYAPADESVRFLYGIYLSFVLLIILFIFRRKPSLLIGTLSFLILFSSYNVLSYLASYRTTDLPPPLSYYILFEGFILFIFLPPLILLLKEINRKFSKNEKPLSLEIKKFAQILRFFATGLLIYAIGFKEIFAMRYGGFGGFSDLFFSLFIASPFFTIFGILFLYLSELMFMKKNSLKAYKITSFLLLITSLIVIGSTSFFFILGLIAAFGMVTSYGGATAQTMFFQSIPVFGIICLVVYIFLRKYKKFFLLR